MNVQNFRIDLTDLSASGVYMVSPDDLDTVDEAATRDGFNVHRIDLEDCRDHAALNQRMAEGFSLPKSFGKNWDQLVEYLQRMDAIPSRGHIVLLRNSQGIQQANPEDWERTLDMLETTAAIWASEGVAFFVFLPQAASETAAPMSV